MVSSEKMCIRDRYRIEAPVDKDAELCAGVPVGKRMTVERLECWFIFCWSLRGTKCTEENECGDDQGGKTVQLHW